MTRPIEAINIFETGETIYQEMSDVEYTIYLADREAETLAKIEEIAAAEQAATAKAALLAKLGITEEEARLLLS